MLRYPTVLALSPKYSHPPPPHLPNYKSCHFYPTRLTGSIPAFALLFFCQQSPYFSALVSKNAWCTQHSDAPRYLFASKGSAQALNIANYLLQGVVQATKVKVFSLCVSAYYKGNIIRHIGPSISPHAHFLQSLHWNLMGWFQRTWRPAIQILLLLFQNTPTVPVSRVRFLPLALSFCKPTSFFLVKMCAIINWKWVKSQLLQLYSECNS